MDFFRALRGHKVEEENDIEAFLEYYNNNNKLFIDDEERIQLRREIVNARDKRSTLEATYLKGYTHTEEEQGLIEEKENEIQSYYDKIAEIYEKYALKQGVCYNRIKTFYGKEKTKLVGNLLGVKLMSYTETARWITDEDGDEHRASILHLNYNDEVEYKKHKLQYWLLKFSNGTVTYSEGDNMRKWFVPCTVKPNTKTRKARRQKRKQTRRTR
jgi:hypothetical protein